MTGLATRGLGAAHLQDAHVPLTRVVARSSLSQQVEGIRPVQWGRTA